MHDQNHNPTRRLRAGFFQMLGGERHKGIAALALAFCCGLLPSASASDWKTPAQQLARKIATVTGPGAVAVTIENRSSLGKKDFDSIGASLRENLESMGARSATPEQAAASVAITLSENPRSYVWVAEVRQGSNEPAIVLVSLPRGDEAPFGHESAPITLRKIPLWAQEDRILDVAVLETALSKEDNAPRHIAVLDPDKVAIYRLNNGKWQLEQSLAIPHARPWPRDLRGRVLTAKDHWLEVYLPGVFCQTTSTRPLALDCEESDDPWPLVGGPNLPSPGAFYSSSRNFFTGALTPGVGKLTTVGKFYSAAALPRSNYALWLFAATNGQVHFVDGVTDQAAKLNWGSDIASVKTSCGSGWQVLAASNQSGATADSIRAYEVADRDPVPVSAPLDFSGEVTALWTESKGDGAIVVDRNRQTGEYESFRLVPACGQ